jgi:hypothetical protein
MANTGFSLWSGLYFFVPLLCKSEFQVKETPEKTCNFHPELVFSCK